MGINVHKKDREKRIGKRVGEGEGDCNQKVNRPETVTVVISIISQGLGRTRGTKIKQYMPIYRLAHLPPSLSLSLSLLIKLRLEDRGTILAPNR